MSLLLCVTISSCQWKLLMKYKLKEGASLKIWQKIERYSAAYHALDICAPPYRITEMELIELRCELANLFCPIRGYEDETFFGIKLELVRLLNNK